MQGNPIGHAPISLPELHRQVVRGESNGKIIWQPRIQCWITDKRFAGEALPEPFEHLSVPDMYRELKCSSRLYVFNACFVPREDPRVRIWREDISETDYKEAVETPVGGQFEIRRKTPTSPALIRIKGSIDSEEEMRVAAWRARHTEWTFDQERYDALMEEWGDLGLPTMYMPRVSVQDLFINTMGVEKAIYAIYGWGSVVEEYFQALHKSHMRLIEVINASPIEVINFGDNLHCETLTPHLYEQYVLPAYLERCDKLHQAGKFVHSHWDGSVRSLFPYARTSGLDGIEAITPKPQGDVTLEETKEALGDDMFLIDGVPAVYFDTIFPEELLIESVEKIIRLFAPKLILGISDEISSTGDIERVRTVGRIVDEYNAQCEKKAAAN